MPNCKNDKETTYKGDEPSPKGLGYCAHAEKVGTIMKGKDGNKWIIKETKTKIKRWVKIEIKAGKKYYIHDNGSRPFMVVINKTRVYVYKKTDLETDNYDKEILDIKVKEIFIGKHSGDKNFNSNSILLQLTNSKFICITDSIFEFELEKGDEIVKYFSEVGNSDVPYPVLLGKNNFYSMVDKTYGSRDDFPSDYKINDYKDGHGYYYGKFVAKKGWVSTVKKYKLPHLKTIQKRL